MLGDHEPDLRVRNQMDRLHSDCETLIGDAIDWMSKRSTKTKAAGFEPAQENQRFEILGSASHFVSSKSALSCHSSCASS